VLYFAWEDQRHSRYYIFHKVLINYMYESYSTVMQLIGQIRYSYVPSLANTTHLGKYSTVTYVVNLLLFVFYSTSSSCHLHT